MSYAYKIKLERLSGEVNQQGAWRPNLMEILSPDEMKALFREALQALGWKPQSSSASSDTDSTVKEYLSLVIDGVNCIFDEEQGVIKAKVQETVYVEQTVTADSDDSTLLKQARIEEGKRQQKQKLENAKQDKSRQLTTQLVTIESKVKAQIDQASHQTHAEALKIKAARLGEIKSSQSTVDSEGTLEVTIHVQMK